MGLIQQLRGAPRALKVILIGYLRIILKRLGFRLISTGDEKDSRSKGVHLNIGSGGSEIDGFLSVDYFSDGYYANKQFDCIHYDMRGDNLPFEDDSVDTIYCSHVIEHIETEYVEMFFKESFRVLKLGGVLRIVCPDVEYLYNNLKDNPEYFSWHPRYRNIDDALICFIDEVANPKVEIDSFGLKQQWSDYDYDELLEDLRSDLKFDERIPNDHINSWDFGRISSFVKISGFSCVTRSRCQGSYRAALRGGDMDLTMPQMSLYVDVRK